MGDAFIRYYLHLDPTKMTDDEWAENFNAIMLVKKFENPDLKKK